MSVRQVPPYIDPTERGSYDTDELDALEARRCAAITSDRARYVVQAFSGQTLVVDTLLMHRVAAFYNHGSYRPRSAAIRATATAERLNRDTA